MKTKPPTIKQVIKQLQKLNPNLPLYLRSKYSGETNPFDNYPVNINGISEMQENVENGKKYAVFLF